MGGGGIVGWFQLPPHQASVSAHSKSKLITTTSRCGHQCSSIYKFPSELKRVVDADCSWIGSKLWSLYLKGDCFLLKHTG